MSHPCNTFRQELAARLRGSSDVTNLGWHEHLLACGACRELLEGEQALEALLASLPEPRLPSALAERVLARLEGVRADERLELLLARVPAPEPPADLAARMQQRLAAARRVRERRFTPALRAIAAGLLIAGAAGAWWLFFGRRGAPPIQLGPPEVVHSPATGPEVPAPDPEMLAALELLESWDVVTDDDLDFLLSSIPETDEALLESGAGATESPEAPQVGDETPRRNG